ncbi:hypothetical protein MKW94_010924 [Papaver nudicaule]|uniref:peptidyl-tRNA hydrolase n=1 Tax=Papaver nudicaule TaxID=74823 RepID=A0AA41S2G8_PAPNU|nr:hypothetical protein [Papaver nudicaule]MCL7043435.1 hypothetical protein [Papaver nudicaule]
MFGLFRNSSDHSRKQRTQRDEREWSGISFSPENFIPGLIIGFVFGLLIDLAKLPRNPRKICAALGKRKGGQQRLNSNGGSSSDEELKMVLVVRQDLRMGPGKIASQCAHAATGMYAELMQSQRYILSQWEQCGQPKIVVSCKNQLDMNRLKNTAESIGLPTFIVADAGRTEVVAGSKTVLAIGPGRKASVDSVTGKLRLL